MKIVSSKDGKSTLVLSKKQALNLGKNILYRQSKYMLNFWQLESLTNKLRNFEKISLNEMGILASILNSLSKEINFNDYKIDYRVVEILRFLSSIDRKQYEEYTLINMQDEEFNANFQRFLHGIIQRAKGILFSMNKS